MRSHSNGKGLLEKAENRYSAYSKLVRKGSAKAKSFIQAKPVLATVIGLATGFVLAMIMRSRK